VKSLFKKDGKHIAGRRSDTLISDGIRNFAEAFNKKFYTNTNGYQIFHNYVRPHMGLDGQTPAERCGIKIEGENKWLTLIQKAERNTK